MLRPLQLPETEGAERAAVLMGKGEGWGGVGVMRIGAGPD